jgi:membrane-bound metal-dependent hydrolase YbcI (DUF457 family)
MTVYEHAMLGWTLAITVGCHRRQGWAIAAMAGLAAALSDIDGVSLLFGPVAFANIHRIWAHNILVAAVLGLLTGLAGYLSSRSLRVQRGASAVMKHLASDVKMDAPVAKPFVGRDCAVWMAMGTLAALSHLPTDIIFNGSAELPPWPVPLGWPFSERGWELPIVPWGDQVTTVILIAEMFCLYFWSNRSQAIAGLTLLAIAVYVGIRWLVVGLAA